MACIGGHLNVAQWLVESCMVPPFIRDAVGAFFFIVTKKLICYIRMDEQHAIVLLDTVTLILLNG